MNRRSHDTDRDLARSATTRTASAEALDLEERDTDITELSWEEEDTRPNGSRRPPSGVMRRDTLRADAPGDQALLNPSPPKPARLPNIEAVHSRTTPLVGTLSKLKLV